jgi:hypothetical protein
MKFKLLAATLFLLAVSLPAVAQNTYVDYNHAIDFTKIKTYAWGEGANANQIANSFLAQQAQSQVNAQLQAKGVAMVTEAQNPDVIVVMSGGLKQQTSYTAMAMGGGWRFGGGMGTVTPQTNLVGTLVVDIYSVSTKQLVWRGVASDTLNESNSSKNNKTVANAVKKMFKQYP